MATNPPSRLSRARSRHNSEFAVSRLITEPQTLDQWGERFYHVSQFVKEQDTGMNRRIRVEKTFKHLHRVCGNAETETSLRDFEEAYSVAKEEFVQKSLSQNKERQNSGSTIEYFMMKRDEQDTEEEEKKTHKYLNVPGTFRARSISSASSNGSMKSKIPRHGTRSPSVDAPRMVSNGKAPVLQYPKPTRFVDPEKLLLRSQTSTPNSESPNSTRDITIPVRETHEAEDSWRAENQDREIELEYDESPQEFKLRSTSIDSTQTVIQTRYGTTSQGSFAEDSDPSSFELPESPLIRASMTAGTSRSDAITVKKGKRQPIPSFSKNQRSIRGTIEGVQYYSRSRGRSPTPSPRQPRQPDDFHDEPVSSEVSSLEKTTDRRSESQAMGLSGGTMKILKHTKGKEPSPEPTLPQQEQTATTSSDSVPHDGMAAQESVDKSTEPLPSTHVKTDTFIIKQAAAERIIRENERSISGARNDMKLITMQDQERRAARVTTRVASSARSQGTRDVSRGELRAVSQNVTPKTPTSKKRTPPSRRTGPNLPSSARHHQRMTSFSSQRYPGTPRRVSAANRTVYATPTRINPNRPRIPTSRVPPVRKITPLSEKTNRVTPPKAKLTPNPRVGYCNGMKPNTPRPGTEARKLNKRNPLGDISGIGASKKKPTGRTWLRRKTSQPLSPEDDRQENVRPTTNENKRNSGIVNTISTWLKSDRNTSPGRNRRNSTTGSIFGTAGRAASRVASRAASRAASRLSRSRTPQPHKTVQEPITPANQVTSPDEHFKISQEDVDKLVKALDSKQPLKKDSDGFTTLDGRYYSKNVPTLEESPSKEDREQNPVAVCMRLIEEARTEPNHENRDKMMALCTLFVDTVVKTADTQTTCEQTAVHVGLAEQSYRDVMKHAKKLEDAVLDSRLLAIRAERSALDAQETLLQTAKLIRSWRADCNTERAGIKLGQNAGESQQA
ncbi:hypothetical protein EDC01DRAFT_631796 [Geopyxis carbonaria]|nr:hypothetical protein EDC01DRAFT_631796 [Geopyxis carbonaria]